MLHNTDDLRIQGLRPLISPAILIEEFPVTDPISTLVTKTRTTATNIITGNDDRLLVVVGPCSVHDSKAVLDYARQLQPLIQQYQHELCIIMRVYFEKPRTTVGWKGLINDPNLDDSFEINTGLRTARKLLIDLPNLGIPAGTEFLDTIIPQFIADIISWGAIGARTVESQVHRELASGLSMPVGFKNSTAGNIQVAIDAIAAARNKHHFLSVTKQGIPAIVSTKGNDACHIILRGSKIGPNYDSESVDNTAKMLTENQLTTRLMIDCSHGNSGKDHNKQIQVAKDIAKQISAGQNVISGIMLESFLQAGNQPLKANTELTYGQSITDACMSWEQTKPLIDLFASAVKQRRSRS